MADAPVRHAAPPELSAPAKASRFRSLLVTLLQFLRPQHVLRPRDRCRTITPFLLIGVLPEPVHAGRSDAEISPITQFARVPGKELPQKAPSCPVPVCPAPALPTCITHIRIRASLGGNIPRMSKTLPLRTTPPSCNEGISVISAVNL